MSIDTFIFRFGCLLHILEYFYMYLYAFVPMTKTHITIKQIGYFKSRSTRYLDIKSRDIYIIIVNYRHFIHRFLFLQINIWETFLFVLMTLGSGACIQRMRSLTLRQITATMPLEHALLLVTQCGVYLYYLFQIIGASFVMHKYAPGISVTR